MELDGTKTAVLSTLGQEILFTMYADSVYVARDIASKIEIIHNAEEMNRVYGGIEMLLDQGMIEHSGPFTPGASGKKFDWSSEFVITDKAIESYEALRDAIAADRRRVRRLVEHLKR